MDFDEVIDRRGTGSNKWDGMAASTGVTASDGLAMWVADMDFRAPDFLQNAVKTMLETANYGYFTGLESFREAVCWWMQTRHSWHIQPEWIFTTYGLGNGIGVCLQTYTDPGDEVIIFTPVYHEFTKKIWNSGRVVQECPLAIENGVYHMDFDAYEARMTGRERAVLFCSPHNPAGRIWTPGEQRQLVDFCNRHNLILISDEIHHDLVYPGQEHVPLLIAAPEAQDRTIMLTSSSKTFNTAGSRLGCVIVADPDLRSRFAATMKALDISPNLLGVRLTEAAYSPDGAKWVDALTAYLHENHRVFLEGAAHIPGVVAMPMQSTYLTWLNFENTGMAMAEVIRRVHEDARIAPSIGADFGTGGETYLRFNIGTPRANVNEAVARLRDAFSDLQ